MVVYDCYICLNCLLCACMVRVCSMIRYQCNMGVYVVYFMMWYDCQMCFVWFLCVFDHMCLCVCNVVCAFVKRCVYDLCVLCVCVLYDCCTHVARCVYVVVRCLNVVFMCVCACMIVYSCCLMEYVFVHVL